jgi:hypothetical protein
MKLHAVPLLAGQFIRREVDIRKDLQVFIAIFPDGLGRN